MTLETKHDTVMDTYDQNEETNVQAELREMIQEIAQYSIDHVVVENLKNTEQKYVKALPEMEKQITSLKSTIKELEGEKNKLLAGIEKEQKLLSKDREMLNVVKQHVVVTADYTKESLHMLTNENAHLKNTIDQALAENISVKKTIESITKAISKVETELSNTTAQLEKLAETTDAGFEVSHSLRSQNHKFTLGLMFTVLIVQFGILAFLLV